LNKGESRIEKRKAANIEKYNRLKKEKVKYKREKSWIKKEKSCK